MATLKYWLRPLALGLAAVAICAASASAQTMSLAEQIKHCGTCHGEDGNSNQASIPSLAGQPAFFILNQLFLMRERVRKVETMAAIVQDLNDEDLEALAKHYAGLVPRRIDDQIDPALAKHGAEIAAHRRCGSCHRPDLAGQEQIPRLAKQRIDYLIPTLKSYRDQPRPGADTAMSANIAGASDAELAALAHYAASL